MSGLLKLKEKLSSFQIIILGFVMVIVLGALLLMLPISARSGEFTSFGTALFTATSAVCVTGLVVVDTATYWSYFGQVVILALIQVGGLGVITVASTLYMLSGRKISLRQRQTMQNAISAPCLGGMVRLTRFIIITTIVIEGAGAALLMPVFIPRYGLAGIWMSVFHSISAFCNAGFDIMGSCTGQFSSLTSFADNGYLNMIICALIVSGGIGFITWSDIATRKYRIKEYKMQTKVILVTTTVLIILPAIFFFFNDFTYEPFGTRLWHSVFQSITPRTAGFNTADYGRMSDSGRALTMLLMLIGGSPGSTAGGMKTTTIAVLFANTMAVLKMRRN